MTYKLDVVLAEIQRVDNIFFFQLSLGSTTVAANGRLHTHCAGYIFLKLLRDALNFTSLYFLIFDIRMDIRW